MSFHIPPPSPPPLLTTAPTEPPVRHPAPPRAQTAPLRPAPPRPSALPDSTTDSLYSSDVWVFFTSLAIRTFTPEVLEQVREHAVSNPHLCLKSHVRLLADIIARHVRLALEEAPQRNEMCTPPRRLAFKKRAFSLRPPPTVPRAPPVVSSADVRRTLSSAALLRPPTTFDASAEPGSRCAFGLREWSRSYRDLDTRRRNLLREHSPDRPCAPPPRAATPPPSCAAPPLPRACVDVPVQPAPVDSASFVRAKSSSWRARTKRRSGLRENMSAPFVALLQRRERKSRERHNDIAH